MTFLIQWFLCVICSFLLVKSWLETVLKPFGGLVQVWRDDYQNDPEISDDEKWENDKAPYNLIAAVFWTLILVINIFIWPIVLCIMLWYKMFPKKFLEDLK